MSLSPYSKYKPSGVEWLGDVPTHWELKAVRQGFGIQLGKMLQPYSKSPQDSEVPYFKAQHVQWETVSTEDLPSMWSSPSEEAQYEISTGDLLVCEGGEVGRAGIVQNPPPKAIIQNALHRVRPVGANDTRFLMYVLEHASSQSYIDILCNRSTIAHFTAEKFGNLKIPFPPPLEQRAIATFLDRETEKIDTLVAKKRTLIERIKEERTVLITHTVTRGLPPEAARAAGLEPHPKLKSSGVEWLGEVPTHWEVKKLKNVCSQSALYGANVSSIHYEEEGVRFLRTTDISDEGVLKNGSVFIHPDLIRGYMLDDGDLLLSRSGTVGRSFLYESQYHGPCSYAGYLVRFVPASGVLPKYLFLFTQTQAFHNFLQVMAISSTIENVNGEKYANASFCIPTLSEQRAIADFLDRETTKIDMLMTKIKTAIERLQEYRSALITAAVTGKIDVRKEAAL